LAIKRKSAIFIGAILALLLFISIVYNINQNKEYQLTEQDKTEILSIVNKYYESIVKQNFYEALQYCDLENSEIDLETRIIALKEVWDGVIEQFELEYKPTEVDKIRQGNNTKFFVNIVINLKYKDTIGGLVNEFVYVIKVNEGWKIQKIRGLDRYGFYRIGEYEYDKLIDFLDPEFKL
jgi:hypothetical protein